MLRRAFLKLLGLGVPAAVVLPMLPVPVDPYEGVAAKSISTLFADTYGQRIRAAYAASSDRFFMALHPSTMENLVNVGVLDGFEEEMRDEGIEPSEAIRNTTGTARTWKGITFIESANLPAEGLTLEKVRQAKALLNG